MTAGVVAQDAAQMIQDLSWRNIGNANQKGRISVIDALDDDWTHVIVGSASGGVWKSVNGGTTFDPIFENYGAASIGDVRLFQPNPNIIWIGTGEECGRNTAAWGNGVYKSTDGGQSFDHVGLANTYSIGTVLTHPSDPDTVYVAALGTHWGEGVGDRGFFKTIDGGQTWQKLSNGLPNHPQSGAGEAVMHPTDPNTIYVAFYERRRQPYRLDSGGPNGGVFKTTDGGQTFRKLTNGFPDGDSGKIGLAISRSNPNVLMAHYEHGFQPGRGSADYDDMSKLGSGLYRSEDAGESWTYVNRYWARPFYYNHVAISPHDENRIFSFNQGFQVSEDGGRTLGRFSASGHCWHAIWLDPHNEDRFYQGNDGGLYLTHDNGGSWQSFKNINVTQYYTVGVDMRDPYWVYGGLQDAGTSGGPSMTRGSGIYTNSWISVGGGDGFHVQIDPTDYRTVYSEPHPGNSGGNLSRRNIETGESTSLRPAKGRNIVNYDEYITPEIEQLQQQKGWGSMGAFRWNWSSPMIISPHNPRTILYGANHVFKSVDRGDTWHIISPDLSKNEYEKTIKESGGLTPDHSPGGGAEFYGTLITISQSPVDADVIWAGTDDGNVQVTRNGGETWTNVAPNMRDLPSQNFWISWVEGSHFDAGTCYVSVDGHRSANFDPHVYKTTDYGENWTNITSNIPKGQPVYVVKEDRKNPNLLFAGTEFGVYCSTNDGMSWTHFNNNLPTVAVHDLVVHPRDADLIIGTHGRGLWIMDDISGLQQLTSEVLAKDAHLFENEVGTQWVSKDTQGRGGSLAFVGENPDKNATINYYLGPNVSGTVTIEVANADGSQTWSQQVEARQGVGKVSWNMRLSGQAAPANAPARGGRGQAQRGRGQRGGQRGRGGRGGGGRGRGRGGRGGGGGQQVDPGTYLVKLTANGNTVTGSITVRKDPIRD